jgi:hypothetical protein
MTCIEVRDQQWWEERLTALPATTFLQSWDWGELQQRAGRVVTRLGSADGRFMAQLIGVSLPFGHHAWTVPAGPVCAADMTANEWTTHLQSMRAYLREHHPAVFLRCEPRGIAPVMVGDELRRIPHVHPRTTLVFDLTQTEEKLLAGMEKKTRYNVHLAERKGVTVRQHDHLSAWPACWRVFEEMRARQEIGLHRESYYRLQLEQLLERRDQSLWVRLYTAEIGGDVAAVALVYFYSGRATVVHGATSRAHSDAKAAYLLRWHMLRDAKALGYQEFDFFGVNPVDVVHPAYRSSWEGISAFKRGFGGRLEEYPGTFELPLRAGMYRIYELAKRLR